MSDAVAIFAEGTFEEQVRELVDYVSKPRVDEERTAFIRPFAEALATPEGEKPFGESVPRRRKVIELVLTEVKGLGEGSEREIEGFFNLLIAQFLDVIPVDAQDAPVKQILTVVSSAPAPTDPSVKYRILANLFNALPTTSPRRLVVAEALIALAQSASDLEELDALQLSRPQVEKWFTEWDVSAEAKSVFLKTVADAFAKAGKEDIAYAYLLDRLRLIPAGAAQAESASLETISAALRIPSVSDFDELAKIPALQSAKGHPLFALLKIFMFNGIQEYLAWAAANAAVLEQHSLPNSVLEHKIRLLTLATLASQNVGRDLPYSQIASGIQIDEAKVESWVIDVIRAGLVSGKLSQPTKTLRVTRSTTRSFERSEWEALERRLATWKAGLAGVLEVVAAARGGSASQIVSASA
ncbi:hypothetical protein BKA62DRAFT_689294 [Auriculariales sp. MPI-PUGE-AT-0066]|nr:hypothetical protein BKA62DRAFT_689294 [Auriculariales sp. MPI-PUGE-AT-0066]